MNSNETPPPRYPSPLPEIPPQSRAPLELLLQTEDDEPTVRMLVPPHLLEMSRRGPNWGLLVCLAACLVFWASMFWLGWRMSHG